MTWDEAELLYPECSASWDMLYIFASKDSAPPVLTTDGMYLYADVGEHGMYVWDDVDKIWRLNEPYVGEDMEMNETEALSGDPLHRVLVMSGEISCVRSCNQCFPPKK